MIVLIPDHFATILGRRTRRAFDHFRQNVEEQIAGNTAESEGEEQEREGFEGAAECEPGECVTPRTKT